MKDLSHVKIISAGAGSGKTYRLTEEIYELVKDGRARPESLIVTTFTKKAAGELQGRVAEKLVEKGEIEKSYLVRQSMISTVHGVCASLLDRFAFECGLGFSQNILDEDLEKSYFSEAISKILVNLESNEDETLELLHRCGQENWKEVVLEIAKAFRINGIDAKDSAQQAKKSIESLFDGYTSDLELPSTMVKEIRVAISSITELIDSEDDTTQVTIKAVAKLKEALREMKSKRRPKWSTWHKLSCLSAGKSKGADDFLDSLRSLAVQHSQSLDFRKDVESLIKVYFKLAGEVIQCYQDLKQSRGFMDFVDQESLLLKNLDHPMIVETIKNEVDALLIDEFQDTSPLQLEIFLKLSKIIKVSIWVGDPKQAIFSFRGTDPKLMVDCIDSIIDAGGTSSRLEKSWRSTHGLVQWVNSSFKEAFKSQGIPANQVPLKPVRPKSKSIDLESWNFIEADDGRKMSVALEKMALAEQIKNLLSNKKALHVEDRTTKKQRPIGPSDVAVLCRTNDSCRAIAKSLEELGLEVDLAVPGLFSTDEVRLVMAGLSLVMDRGDHLASGEITYLLDVEEGKQSVEEWMSCRLKQMDSEASRNGVFNDSEVLKELFESLKELSESCTPSVVARVLIEKMKLSQFMFKHGNTLRRQGNLELFIQHVDKYEASAISSGRPASLGGLMVFLSKMGRDELDLIATTGNGGVSVLTWHRSKGLEWPFVIIYESHKVSPPRTMSVRSRSSVQFDPLSPLKGREVRFWPNPYSDKTSKGSHYLDHIESTSDHEECSLSRDQEDVRLLYVVTTRARDKLAIASRPGKTKAFENIGVCIPSEENENKNWLVKNITVSLSPKKATPESLRIFKPSERKEFSEGMIFPSSYKMDSIQVKVVESIDIGVSLKLIGQSEDERLGNLFHDYMAIESENINESVMTNIASEMIVHYECQDIIEASDLCQYKIDFNKIFIKKLNANKILREQPFEFIDDGVITKGIIDLISVSESHAHIYDYKTFSGTASELEKLSLSYAGQLLCYKKALQALGKYESISTSLIYPIQGEVISLEW